MRTENFIVHLLLRNLSRKNRQRRYLYYFLCRSRLKYDPERSCKIAGIITTMKQEKHGPWTGEIDPQRFNPSIVFGD
jgi:hypothetical protein